MQILRRAIVVVKGNDGSKFLNGLTTNIIPNVGHALPSAFLSPQGRVLTDAILYHPKANEFWVEVDSLVVEDVFKHLKRFKLRADVNIEMADKTVGWNKEQQADGEFYWKDSRYAMGYRSILPQQNLSENTETYDCHRFSLGIPEGSKELIWGQSFPLESNFDYTRAADFRKGCYVGQELTIRTFHTGVTRKRILTIELKTNAEKNGLAGKDILANGKKVGVMRAHLHDIGLGLLRLESISKELQVDGVPVIAKLPTWWKQENKV